MPAERSIYAFLLALCLSTVIPLSLTSSTDVKMDLLQRLGIDASLSKSDFLSTLSSFSITALKDVRYALFSDAVHNDLVPERKALSAGPPPAQIS